MSLSALTAMAVAAAAVPSGEPPAPVAPVGYEAVAISPDSPDAVPTAATDEPVPFALAQATELPELQVPGESTELPESTDPVDAIDPLQPPDPAATAQPGSPAQAPANGTSQIIVTGRRASPDDPLEELNLPSFKATQAVDKAFIAPVAFAYKSVMPRPIRKGLRNFLQNLGEPVVFVNFLLQMKPGRAMETLGRFVVNTTIGAGGIVDVAKRKPFNLPHRNNGFADTLGFYGVKPGPYFYLPLVGPTTLRDFIGGRLDLLFLPTIFGNLFHSREVFVPLWILSELDRRIESDEQLTEIQKSPDPYSAMRTYYLKKRQAEIEELRGHKVTTNPPASTGPALTPRSPTQYPPRSWTMEGSQTWATTGTLLRGLSVAGTNSYALLTSDFSRSTIILGGGGS